MEEAEKMAKEKGENYNMRVRFYCLIIDIVGSSMKFRNNYSTFS